MEEKKKLSALLLGWGALSRFLPLTAPACEYDKRKITVLCIQGGFPAVNVVFRMLPELETEKTKIRIGGIELTSANATQAQEILERLADICGLPDKEGFVTEKLSQLEEKKYRKRIPLELEADLPEITDPQEGLSGIPGSASSLSVTQMPENALYRFLNDEKPAQHINELTLCFRMSPELTEELADNGYNELELREATGFVQGEAQLRDTTALHLAAQRSGIIFVSDTPLYDILTESRRKQLKTLLEELPAAVVMFHSERLDDMLDDIGYYQDNPEKLKMLRDEYLKAATKMRSRNITEIYDRLSLKDPLTDAKGGPFSLGLSTGKDFGDYELCGTLFAYALGLTADKMNELYSTDTGACAELLRPCAETIAERIDECEKYDLTGFLGSDRPLIHPSGGITMKSHNKYKYAESCELAVIAYDVLCETIDGGTEKMTDTERTLLRGALLRFADSYALYDGKTLIDRYELVKAAEAARNEEAEDIVLAFAENVVSEFIEFIRRERERED